MVSVLPLFVVCDSWAGPMGTAFTYQGRLIDANNPADGLYDFLFRLYDANVTGTQKGSTINIGEVDVIDGYFTVELDFGSKFFDGDARWLQIDIRPGELNDPNRYTILRPRQQVAPTPYALYADMLDGLHALDFATVSHNHDLRYYTEAESDLRYVNVTGDAIAGTNIWVLSVENTGTGNGIDGTGQDIAVRGTASAGTGVGVCGNAQGSNGYGVYGYASNTSNFTNYGGWFAAAGSGGRGVYGKASNSGNFTNCGGYFQAAGGYGYGVYGVASNSGNFTNYGGWFAAAGSFGQGVYGLAINGGNFLNYGGYFKAAGGLGRGVYGYASNSGDYYNYGGYFEAAGGYGRGVYGEASNSGNFTNYGGLFRAAGSNGYGVYGEATNTGNYTNFGGYFYAAGIYGRGVYGWGKAYDFYAAGPGTDYGSSSSIRWKRDIRPIDEALDKVMMLRGVYFNWDAEHGGEHDVGMVAEEVGEVLPEIVEYEENGIDATGMDYGKLTPLLVEAVKALESELDQLRKENTDLRNRIESLEKMMAEVSSLQEGVR